MSCLSNKTVPLKRSRSKFHMSCSSQFLAQCVAHCRYSKNTVLWWVIPKGILMVEGVVQACWVDRDLHAFSIASKSYFFSSEGATENGLFLHILWYIFTVVYWILKVGGELGHVVGYDCITPLHQEKKMPTQLFSKVSGGQKVNCNLVTPCSICLSCYADSIYGCGKGTAMETWFVSRLFVSFWSWTTVHSVWAQISVCIKWGI